MYFIYLGSHFIFIPNYPCLVGRFLLRFLFPNCFPPLLLIIPFGISYFQIMFNSLTYAFSNNSFFPILSLDYLKLKPMGKAIPFNLQEILVYRLGIPPQVLFWTYHVHSRGLRLQTTSSFRSSSLDLSYSFFFLTSLPQIKTKPIIQVK